MDKDQLSRDYNKKKEREGREKEEREKKNEAVDEIVDSIGGMSDKRFSKFFQNELQEIKDPKLQKAAVKQVHKKLKEMVEKGKLAGYDMVRQLYRSRAKYELTEQQFKDFVYGEKEAPKIDQKRQKISYSQNNWKPSTIKNNTYFKTFSFYNGKETLLELYLKQDINTDLDLKRPIESLKEIKARIDEQDDRFQKFLKKIPL